MTYRQDTFINMIGGGLFEDPTRRGGGSRASLWSCLHALYPGSAAPVFLWNKACNFQVLYISMSTYVRFDCLSVLKARQ